MSRGASSLTAVPIRDADEAPVAAPARPTLSPADLGLDPVLARRAHESAAAELRRLILLRVVNPGERLPNELELAQALDVSHVTIRAALRELEADGLLEIRRGRHGGAYITGVPALGGGSARVGALKKRAAALRHALELRRLLEPEAAALAAARTNKRGLGRLRRAHTQVVDREERPDSAFMAADTAFHLEIARASGNPLIATSIEQILSELAPALQALPESGAWHNRSIVEHERIVTCVMDGDSDGARVAMATHVAGTERAIEVLLQGLIPAPRRSAGSARGHSRPPASST
jgi:GntR family transcriptional repressor for pyruvate dehydrogenase complex